MPIRLREPAARAYVTLVALIGAGACGDVAGKPPTSSTDGHDEQGIHVLPMAPQNAQATSTVRGRVVLVDAAASDFSVLGPLPNVAVSVYGLRPSAPGEPADTLGLVRGSDYGRVVTDGDGHFTLTNVPEGYLLFMLEAPDSQRYRTVRGGYLGIARAETRDHVLYVWTE